VGLLLLIGVWYWLRSCNQSPAGKPVTDTVTTAERTTTTDTVTAIQVTPVQLTLPNGVKINALKDGVEERLIAFIQDGTSAPGKDNWFDFHMLNFSFGTANILPGSRAELENIALILKAYPKVKVKIGGYTDKVGDEAVNKKLSQARADAVARALREAGVGGQVTGAEGYGAQYAQYPADAPEQDRLKDRRIAISVREK
ncbi:MAG TPA: OmpA family protein, partial [Chitinophaga sp.]